MLELAHEAACLFKLRCSCTIAMLIQASDDTLLTSWQCGMHTHTLNVLA
jgi:hypothetical protein